VRFRVTVEAPRALVCNCSMCAKKGSVHLIVPKARFALLQGEEALTTYTFNTGIAKHTFCKRCGIHPFYTPRSHPEDVDVNVRCLDGDAMAEFVVERFDGKNWEANVHTIR
jgi:hypothetical protein